MFDELKESLGKKCGEIVAEPPQPLLWKSEARYLDPMKIPSSWLSLLHEEVQQDYVRELEAFLQEERRTQSILPADDEVFEALALTPPERVRVVILGQDPYPTRGHAHGLCFSVREGVKPPASLVNIYRELEQDLGVPAPTSGCLRGWAKQGVLLLNAVLTVREGEPNSHKGKGWERFTDAILTKLNAQQQPLVFVLWGAMAQKKLPLIDVSRHAVVKSAHPSPLSVKKFRGTRPFSQVNEALQAFHLPPIDWARTTDDG